MGLSWAVTGINFIVTVHNKRAAGMGFFQMPILSWSLYLTGYILAFAGLVFAIIIMYLAAAKVSGKGLFALGSNPLDWQNYFWFVTTPAAFFALLPAAGVITEVIAGISRKAVAGYRMVVGSLIALLALSFVTWGVHLIGSGQSQSTSFVFAFLSLLAVVPVALISYSWLSTLFRGSIACAPPTTFVVAFMLCGGAGAVMGLFLSALSVGSYLNNTMFATAHAHYVLLGGVTTAFLAGLHYWWPRLTGRLYDPLQGRIGGVLYMVGMNLAFFPQFIMGARGLAAGVPQNEGYVGGAAERVRRGHGAAAGGSGHHGLEPGAQHDERAGGRGQSLGRQHPGVAGRGARRGGRSVQLLGPVPKSDPDRRVPPGARRFYCPPLGRFQGQTPAWSGRLWGNKMPAAGLILPEKQCGCQGAARPEPASCFERI